MVLDAPSTHPLQKHQHHDLHKAPPRATSARGRSLSPRRADRCPRPPRAQGGSSGRVCRAAVWPGGRCQLPAQDPAREGVRGTAQHTGPEVASRRGGGLGGAAPLALPAFPAGGQNHNQPSRPSGDTQMNPSSDALSRRAGERAVLAAHGRHMSLGLGLPCSPWGGLPAGADLSGMLEHRGPRLGPGAPPASDTSWLSRGTGVGGEWQGPAARTRAPAAHRS